MEETLIETKAPVVEAEATPEVLEDRPIQEIMVSELRGKFPDIPVSPAFLEEVRKRDPEPFFITLPIIEINRRSENDLRYVPSLCQSIVEQINHDFPTGIRGHIPEAQRATSYPEPNVFWLGSKIDGPYVYAKAYIPPGATREEYRLKKAQNAPVATSIYGRMKNLKRLEDGSIVGEISLEQIDLAPSKRAALGPIREWVVTSEMSGDETQHIPVTETPPEPEQTQENTMDEASLKAALNALTPEQLASVLDGEKATAFASHVAQKNSQQIVAAEMATVEPQVLAEMTAQAGIISEMKTRLGATELLLQKYEAEKFERTISEQITKATPWVVSADDTKGNALVADLRDTLRAFTISEMGATQTADAITPALNKVLDTRKSLVDGVISALMGPNAAINGADSRTQTVAEIASPEAQEAAKRELGW